MKARFIVPIVLFLATACGASNPGAGTPNGQVYSKGDVSQLPACSAATPCPASSTCLTYGNSPAYCFTQAQISEFLGCSSGSLTLLTSYPAMATCN